MGQGGFDRGGGEGKEGKRWSTLCRRLVVTVTANVRPNKNWGGEGRAVQGGMTQVWQTRDTMVGAWNVQRDVYTIVGVQGEPTIFITWTLYCLAEVGIL